jgi:hypothetical protein
MKIYYIVVSAFLIIFFPRQLTNLICFGRNRDKNIVKSKAVYGGIYLFWTVIFLIGCLMMGSAAKVDSTMDKVVYYFILGSDNRDCAELGSEENDEAYISTYYTRKEINESFLLEVVQKHEYAYELCQLQDLIIKKQDERWILYLNDDVMGYVEVKKGFLIKEFCIVWDRKKIDQRRYGFNKPEKDNKREEDVHMVVHLPFCNTPSEKIWGTFPPV